MKQRSGRAPPARSPPAPGPRRYVPSEERVETLSLSPKVLFSERDRPGAALPGPGVRCPPSAGKRKRGGRDSEMRISAQEPSPSCRFPNNRFPIASL